MQLNRYIDHTMLKANATRADIEKLCQEAKQHEFASVCVNTCFVPLAAELLRRDGYPEGADVGRLLDLLSTRLRMGKEFPHEIGLFLGYPPEDVLGFQRYRGQNCKLCGYWKVYSDVDRARVLFRLYDRCREVLCRRVARGMTLSEVFLAA